MFQWNKTSPSVAWLAVLLCGYTRANFLFAFFFFFLSSWCNKTQKMTKVGRKKREESFNAIYCRAFVEFVIMFRMKSEKMACVALRWYFFGENFRENNLDDFECYDNLIQAIAFVFCSSVHIFLYKLLSQIKFGSSNNKMKSDLKETRKNCINSTNRMDCIQLYRTFVMIMYLMYLLAQSNTIHVINNINEIHLLWWRTHWLWMLFQNENAWWIYFNMRHPFISLLFSYHSTVRCYSSD